MEKNSWRIMWVLASFDLPTQTNEEKLNYTRLRKLLLSKGFIQLQFSVYTKHFETYEPAKASVKILGECVPKNGKVSFFYITDKQFGISENFYGKTKEEAPQAEEQLIMFD